jgi:hypothetical protein
VSGGPSSIVSSDGRNIDVEMGELRYGERKEMLVELELDNSDAVRNGTVRDARHDLASLISGVEASVLLHVDVAALWAHMLCNGHLR